MEWFQWLTLTHSFLRSFAALETISVQLPVVFKSVVGKRTSKNYTCTVQLWLSLLRQGCFAISSRGLDITVCIKSVLCKYQQSL